MKIKGVIEDLKIKKKIYMYMKFALKMESFFKNNNRL